MPGFSLYQGRTLHGDCVTIKGSIAVDEAADYFKTTRKRKPIKLTLFQVIREIQEAPPTDAQLRNLTVAIQNTEVPIVEVVFDPFFLEPVQVETALGFLCALGGKRSITKLLWRNMGDNREATDSLQHLNQLLKNGSSLENLEVRGMFAGSVQEFRDFGAALRDHPMLEWVDLCETKLGEDNKTTACTGPIFSALGSLPRLKSLMVDTWLSSEQMRKESTAEYTELIQLFSLPTVESLQISGHSLNQLTKDAIVQRVEDNYIIQDISFNPPGTKDYTGGEEIQGEDFHLAMLFYEYLNGYITRKTLFELPDVLESRHRSKWVDKLIMASEDCARDEEPDVSALFYLLSSNPMLCENCEHTATSLKKNNQEHKANCNPAASGPTRKNEQQQQRTGKRKEPSRGTRKSARACTRKKISYL